jgi:hypothetical protein
MAAGVANDKAQGTRTSDDEHRNSHHQGHNLPKACLTSQSAYFNFNRGGQIQATRQHAVAFFFGQRHGPTC